jgi:hypothetical protein
MLKRKSRIVRQFNSERIRHYLKQLHERIADPTEVQRVFIHELKRSHDFEVRAASSSLTEVFADDPRVASSDAKQREGGPLWATTALLPVPKRRYANADRAGELDLGQADEASNSRHVLARADIASHQSAPQACRNRAC